MHPVQMHPSIYITLFASVKLNVGDLAVRQVCLLKNIIQIVWGPSFNGPYTTVF